MLDRERLLAVAETGLVESETEEVFDRAYRMLRLRRVVARSGDGYVILSRGRPLISYYANSVAHLLGRAVEVRHQRGRVRVKLVRRALGRSGATLSPIAFGSMRIHERPHDDEHWEALLRASIESGVTTLHSSTEYESYERFCGLVSRLGQPER